MKNIILLCIIIAAIAPTILSAAAKDKIKYGRFNWENPPYD
jgi:hypothetical protein